jgi:predicted RNA-binding protein with PUA-like domain
MPAALRPESGAPSGRAYIPRVPNYWILKSEPSTYAFEQLARDRRTVWDGVTNAQALQNIRRMAPGDPAMFYHTGDVKALVGLARVATAPYADPKAGDPKLAVVDVEYDRPLARPVPLAEIKADPTFAELALVRHGRLSVVEVSAEHWKRLLKLAGGK